MLSGDACLETEFEEDESTPSSVQKKPKGRPKSIKPKGRKKRLSKQRSSNSEDDIIDDEDDPLLREFDKSELANNISKYDFDRILVDPKFNSAEAQKLYKEMEPKEFTMDYYMKTAFECPLRFSCDPRELGMKIPETTLTVDDIADLVGSDRLLDVVRVSDQSSVTTSMGEFAEYYKTPEGDKTELFNVLSLEFSETRLKDLVQSPELIRKIDWIQHWPESLLTHYTKKAKVTSFTPIAEYPKVSYYCLMSPNKSYTDFHIDFGGTSVWYHVLKGRKIFFIVEPTEHNLLLHETTMWNRGQSGFFGDVVETCAKVVLEAGQTLIIPSGWIHSVYTPANSIVFGGNFLHSLASSMQIRVFTGESRIGMAQRFRYPYIDETILYFIANFVELATKRNYVKPLQNCGEDADGEEICKNGLTGVKNEAPFDGNDVTPRPEVFYDDELEKLPGEAKHGTTAVHKLPIDEETDGKIEFDEDFLQTLTPFAVSELSCLCTYLSKKQRISVAQGITRPASLLNCFRQTLEHRIRDFERQGIEIPPPIIQIRRQKVMRKSGSREVSQASQLNKNSRSRKRSVKSEPVEAERNDPPVEETEENCKHYIQMTLENLRKQVPVEEDYHLVPEEFLKASSFNVDLDVENEPSPAKSDLKTTTCESAVIEATLPDSDNSEAKDAVTSTTDISIAETAHWMVMEVDDPQDNSDDIIERTTPDKPTTSLVEEKITLGKIIENPAVFSGQETLPAPTTRIPRKSQSQKSQQSECQGPSESHREIFKDHKDHSIGSSSANSSSEKKDYAKSPKVRQPPPRRPKVKQDEEKLEENKGDLTKPTSTLDAATPESEIEQTKRFEREKEKKRLKRARAQSFEDALKVTPKSKSKHKKDEKPLFIDGMPLLPSQELQQQRNAEYNYRPIEAITALGKRPIESAYRKSGHTNKLNLIKPHTNTNKYKNTSAKDYLLENLSTDRRDGDEEYESTMLHNLGPTKTTDDNFHEPLNIGVSVTSPSTLATPSPTNRTSFSETKSTKMSSTASPIDSSRRRFSMSSASSHLNDSGGDSRTIQEFAKPLEQRRASYLPVLKPTISPIPTPTAQKFDQLSLREKEKLLQKRNSDAPLPETQWATDQLLHFASHIAQLDVLTKEMTEHDAL